MNSVILLLVCAVGYVVAYRTYGRYLGRKIFSICTNHITPANELQDNIDFVPTRREIVFGHHYASIAGTGPIVGPAIAVIWGWLPALIWIFFGSIFMGAVHDFGVLVLSLRNRGESIGEISKRLINDRVRVLFSLVIFFTLWVVVAIFCMIMAVLFDMFPQSVIPIWTQIPIAVAFGYSMRRFPNKITVMSIAAVAMMYISIFIGSYYPLKMPAILGMSPLTAWTIILLIYTYAASVMPVWKLLQPRDFINSYQLFIGLGMLCVGIFVSRAPIVAPAINLNPPGAPPIIPFLFVTVACGAISGFHCMVSSGTTSKQLRTDKDALSVGYGAMLVEGIMAVMVLISVSAGLGMMLRTQSGEVLNGFCAWSHYYCDWAAVQGLGAKVGAFVKGSANLLNSFGIPYTVGTTLMGVFVASFAGTTLDTATRIQRYIINELARESNIVPLKGRHGATFVAVASAAILALSQGGGKGGLILWPLFGTSNQLLAGLALLTLTVYLIRQKIPCKVTFIPMLIIIFFTGWAMIYNITVFIASGEWHLVFIGSIILLLEIWMIVETLIVYANIRKNNLSESNGYSQENL
ncbi:MAG: carbon starvation protein A [Candidatus Auribacterota bacterium]|nr:carbon starvation protein A [Candidatus Auribacterota bacterium]